MRPRQRPCVTALSNDPHCLHGPSITVWAGAIVLCLYFERLGLRTALTGVLTPLTKTSNHQIPTLDMWLAW